jgi:hypothetical protein
MYKSVDLKDVFLDTGTYQAKVISTLDGVSQHISVKLKKGIPFQVQNKGICILTQISKDCTVSFGERAKEIIEDHDCVIKDKSFTLIHNGKHVNHIIMIALPPLYKKGAVIDYARPAGKRTKNVNGTIYDSLL